MKNNRTLIAVIAAVVAVAIAILVAPLDDTVKVSSLMGYGVVLTLLTLGVMEYGASRNTSR